jgi:SAM-dependent methyltransferase
VSEVQYGTEVSSVYDTLISDAVPAEPTVELLRASVTGKDVLELGVGTGRVANAVAPLVRTLVGVDNSPHMLDVYREKGVPENVTLVQADFRAPLPVDQTFDAAYSTLGSLACIGDRESLVAALTNVAARLRPGAELWMEYYSRSLYVQLAAVGEFAVPDAHGNECQYKVTLSEDDILTMATTTQRDGEKIAFDEKVLLLSIEEVESCLEAAGLTPVECRKGGDTDPYDWYVARRAEG